MQSNTSSRVLRVNADTLDTYTSVREQLHRGKEWRCVDVIRSTCANAVDASDDAPVIWMALAWITNSNRIVTDGAEAFDAELACLGHAHVPDPHPDHCKSSSMPPDTVSCDVMGVAVDGTASGTWHHSIVCADTEHFPAIAPDYTTHFGITMIVHV